jgi:hypothetical protein
MFDDDVLLGFGTMYTCQWMPTFWRNILSPSSGLKWLSIPSIVTSALKMETVCFSKMLASTDESTWRQNPEQHHHHPHCHENLKSHTDWRFCVVTVNMVSWYVLDQQFRIKQSLHTSMFCGSKKCFNCIGVVCQKHG